MTTPDLNLTGQQDPSDKNYFDIAVNGLKLNSFYTVQFQWVFADDTLNDLVKNIWSVGYGIATSTLTALPKPKFTSADLTYSQGLLRVRWGGLDYQDNAYGPGLKRINVYVKDNSSPSNTFYLAGFIETANGVYTLPTKPVSHTVRLTAVSVLGEESFVSAEQTVTPVNAPPVDPTNVVAAWSGTDFTVSFTHDTTASANANLLHYLVQLNPPSPNPSKIFTLTPTSGSSQKFSLSLEQNQSVWGSAQTEFSGIITAVDYNNNRSSLLSFSNTTYVSALEPPVITLEETVNGYSVLYTTPASTTFNKIHIEEVVSNASTAPSSGYVEKFNGSSNPMPCPSGTGKRWVRARFSDKVNAYTAYSNIASVTPIDVVAAALDITPPTTATISSAVWSGNDIVISATVASDAKKFIIRLTNGSTVGYFTKFPAVSGTSQTITLTEQELYNTLGSYFTSFSGLFVSADSLDNRDAGVSFTVAQKTNELSSVTPTFTLTSISNGYSVTYTLPAGAAYAKVYASATSGFTPNDSTNLVYSGASPGIVIDPTYTVRYVKIKYFKTDGSTSLISGQESVTPADPGMLSLIDNEVKISTNGSILAGDSATSGARGIFNKTGVYLYDAAGSATSQLLASAASGSPTFITTSAKIADWQIYSGRIENTFYAGTTQYTGLSPSGTYAFWAGSTVSGGNAQANFSVTPAGAVIAKNITISGGSLTVGASSIAASTGKLTSTDAEITGKITASTGQIGNLKIDSGALYTGTSPLVGSVTFNSGGIAAYNGSGTKLFGLDTSGFLEVKSALIADWSVGTTSISKTLSGKTISLDSSTGEIKTTGSGWSAGFGNPDANNIVFWAGSSRATTAPFWVKADGSVNMSGTVTIGGYATSGDLTTGLNGKVGPGQVKDNLGGTGITTISGSIITTGIIKSSNFPGTGSTQAADGTGNSVSGTAFDLVNGTITAKKFRINANGDAFFAGTLSSGVAIDAPVITGGTLNIGQKVGGGYYFSVDSAGTLRAEGAIISGTITASALAINASNYITGTTGAFSLGSGTMTYSGSGDISLNGATLTFTGASNTIFGDDNNYGGDATVVLNQNAQLTKGRAFHYGGTTIPLSTNTSRQIWNSKTSQYNTVAFVAGDIWMTVD